MFPNLDTTNIATMVPLVAASGFLDGIHPCAIAILILFIAILLALQRTFKNIFFYGLVFIAMIFLVYLGVGIGLFSGIMFFGRHHFFAELGSWMLILMGAIYLKGYFFPTSSPLFQMPKFSRQRIESLLKKATLPAVILAGILVGLCAIPCSGGIYVAITALLASKTTYFTGFLYLLLYNFMYILPLIILLFLAANPLILAKLAEFRQKHERAEKLIMGLLLIALGAGILIFFV